MNLDPFGLPGIRQYNEAKPKQFGNMHERMKFLLQEMHANGHASIPNSVGVAIWDLLTEVKNTPAQKSYGQRTIRVG